MRGSGSAIAAPAATFAQGGLNAAPATQYGICTSNAQSSRAPATNRSKSDHQVQTCAWHGNENAVKESARSSQPSPAQHLGDLERHECTVNSSEFAGHAGEHAQSNPALKGLNP